MCAFAVIAFAALRWILAASRRIISSFLASQKVLSLLISCWSSFLSPTGIASFGAFFICCHHMYTRGGEQERIAPLLMQIWDEVPRHLKVKNGISD